MPAVGRVRIIAGKWRARRLKVMPTVRPSQDACRETMFNILGARGVAGKDCLDLYAGSGAFGLEALSRGARSATFVEKSRRVAQALRGNIELLDAGPARVCNHDALAWLRRGGGAAYGLAFVDPPFADSALPGWWEKLLELLAPHLRPAAAVCCEGPAPVAAPPGWSLLRAGRVGAAHWALLGPDA